MKKAMDPVPNLFRSMYSPPTWMNEETAKVQYKRANFCGMVKGLEPVPGASEAVGDDGTRAAVTANMD